MVRGSCPPALSHLHTSLVCFLGDILNALANVSGRKHPSTVQGKQLKMCLPMMPVVLHLVMSQVTHVGRPPCLSPRAELPPPLRLDSSLCLSWTKSAHGFRALIHGNSLPQVFRAHVVTEEFLFSYGTILVSSRSHVWPTLWDWV